MDATVEVAMRLGVDPRKCRPDGRGYRETCRDGTGKTRRVRLLRVGDKAAEAEAAVSDAVGTDELIERIQGGWLDFDAAIATAGPDGQGGPHPASSPAWPHAEPEDRHCSTPAVAKAGSDIKGGKINFRVDKQANLHLVIARLPSTPTSWSRTTAAALDEIPAPSRSSAKGPVP